MIFGNAVLGRDALWGMTNVQQRLSTYNKMTFYGQNTGMVIDKLWGRTVPMTEATVDYYKNNNGFWSIDTYLLGLYNHSLAAGNIVGFNNQITKWLLYREETTTNILSLVKTLPYEELGYIDYTALKDETYRYYLIAANETQASSALLSNYVQSKYYGYYLINVTDNIVYFFNAEISGGDLTQTMQYSKFNNNTQFDSYSVGGTNYISSTVTGAVKRSDDIDYAKPTDRYVLKELKDFIQNPNKKKYLKTRKGEIFEVFTYNYTQSVLNQAIESQPMIVSFSFDEIGSVNV